MRAPVLHKPSPVAKAGRIGLRAMSLRSASVRAAMRWTIAILRLADHARLVGGDGEAAAHQLEQFAVLQQELRLARPPEALVAFHEGLVEQHAARRERAEQRGEERAMQVVGDDHGAERAAGQGPGRSVLEIGLHDLDVRLGGERADVAIDGRDLVAALGEEAGVPAAAGGDVEDRGVRRRSGRPTARSRAMASLLRQPQSHPIISGTPPMGVPTRNSS